MTHHQLSGFAWRHASSARRNAVLRPERAGPITSTCSPSGTCNEHGSPLSNRNPIGTETSQSATLTVIVPPTITTDPASQTNVVGSTVTFNVGVSGSAPFHYQWKKGVVEMLNETNAALVLAGITGAASRTGSSALSYGNDP